MPKSNDAGATYGPMDAPNARPSEEAYTDAMSRHGTQGFTPEDEALVTRYQEVREQDERDGRRDAEDNADAQADERDDRTAGRVTGQATPTPVVGEQTGKPLTDPLATTATVPGETTKGGERSSGGSSSSTSASKPSGSHGKNSR